MTHFLANSDKPEGYRLEDVLTVIRNDLVRRMTKIVDDGRPEAQVVVDHDVKILEHLTEAIHLARDNSKLLHRSFGDSVEGRPRIGVP